MSKNSKAAAQKRAKPTMGKPKRTDVEKVTATRSTTTVMQGSTFWAGSPELQAVNTAWNKAADALEQNAQEITIQRAKLDALETARIGLRHDWQTSTEHMTAVVAVVAGGHVDHVIELGYDVITRVAREPLAAPEGLHTALGKAVGEAILTWSHGTARNGYLVQHATDVSNAATYSSVVPATRPKFTLTGGVPHSVVHFRVAAIDTTVPAGISPWSDWIAATVR